MATVEKFKFGEDFDVVESSLPDAPKDEAFVEEEVALEPSFSEKELEEACAEALAQGRAQAEAEARESTEQRISEAVAAIRIQLEQFAETVADANRQRQQDAIALAATIARKVVPEIARHGAVEALEVFVGECMGNVGEEPRLVIRVNGEVAEPLRIRMGDIAADCGYPGDIAVLAEETLPPTDCRIEWGDGGTDYQAGRIWSEIDDLVQSFLDSCFPPAESLGATVPGDAGGAADPDEIVRREEI